LGFGKLIAVLQLFDSLVQGDVTIPVRFHRIEGTALRHILRPDRLVMGNQLLRDRVKLLTGNIPIFSPFQRLGSHHEITQLITTQLTERIPDRAGAIDRWQDAVGKPDGNIIHVAKLDKGKTADKGDHQTEHGKAGGEFFAYGHGTGIHGISWWSLNS